MSKTENQGEPPPMPRPKIAILASGRGSNCLALLQAVREGTLSADVTAVVSDRADAPVLEAARNQGARVASFEPVPRDRRATDDRLRRTLEDQGGRPDFLVLAGYMRVLSDELIESYRSPRGYTRIVNIHPSLLPAFPGVDSYAQAFHYGAKVAGCTVHLVESEIDSGPICAQAAFEITDCEQATHVEARGLKLEHQLYSRTLAWVLPEKFNVEIHASPLKVRRLCVRPN